MSSKPILIVESPSKAKTISKYLGGEFEVIASVGHIKDLPKKELGVDVDDNFATIEDVLPDKKPFMKELKSLAKKTDRIVIATDPDREGEAIAAHIATEVDKSKLSRVQFTEITKEGVAEGMEHPREIDMDLVAARQTRRIIDRLVGYKVSRVLWSTLKKNMKFVEVSLSAGRVQSSTLKIIVERERLRQAFHSALYYDLKANLLSGEKPFSANLIRVDGKRLATGKDFDPNTGELKKQDALLLSKAQADALVKELKSGAWTVSDVEEKIKNSHPKPPFTTSTLQQEAARKIRSSARKTMRTAQRLYEQGFITYMRTDSTSLSGEGINGARNEILSRFGKEYLPEKPIFYASKVKNAQEAHEAIRPAGVTFSSVDAVRSAIDEDAAKLYDLIRKRTLASQMTSAKVKQIGVTIENQKSEFRANGKVILFPGYMAAYVESTDHRSGVTEDKETILPDMTKGQSLNCSELTAEEHSTKPPARFTEASLVKEMEAQGIGRPSTFANIIDTIVYRTYVTRDRGKLTPTFLGVAVTQLLENHFTSLVDSQFTANMEDGLDAISRGELDAVPFMKEFYFGSENQVGLEGMLDDKVDIGKACSVQLDYDGDPIEVRVGQYGPFVQQGEVRKSVPNDVYLGDLNVEKALEILNQEINEDRELGKDSNSGELVLVKNGPYGPYVQLGETSKRKGIPKGTPSADIDLEMALKLLSLPRILGKHPETDEDVKADYGRFGPYVTAGKGKNGTIPPTMSPLTIELAEALELIKNRNSGPQELRTLGDHTTTGESLVLKSGRYGPYLTDGKVNASLPRDTDPEKMTLEEGVALIDKKRAAPPRKKKRKAAKKKKKKK
ncbi:MAG: type I DNA topoisomerase [Candidatus Marinimicrobia bacterium]|jgi:DNA topoisomerase-1|nr:type I DNA topoisomerase [Candidatus Neomarinimicrobiota bacterium]MBT4067609.1 type I DNA topoisomerase [Candidatus Neomarinimicrobiota bacterium]MBT4809270.1 type I DNA topoisomerase [Candidatus Neomarinimicrobiota bacterium]MBT6416867.1 type I DNA topoisomerase [Candidatus Neomarinimicrobiota bacterium]MBT6637829.1 type I DNA topoisomerase [Candidatus Neomarinimicrobiota bacterium]